MNTTEMVQIVLDLAQLQELPLDSSVSVPGENITRVLAGIDAFKLNDTFGFPLDLTKEIAAENGIEVDEDSFRTEMQKQREKARKDRLSRDISGWTADLFGALDASATEVAPLRVSIMVLYPCISDHIKSSCIPRSPMDLPTERA